MDEFVYYGPYGYIEEANYQGITTGGASGGNSETDNEQNQEIAKLNEAVSATSEAVAANTENIETLQSDVDEIKGAGYQTEGQVKDAISEVVDGAPEALDTLKEIADKLSDNDDAVAGLVNSVASAQTAAEAADAKADAVKEELEAKIDEKADASALNETNNAVAALSDRVDAIDVPTLSGYATEDWVEEQGFASADDLTAEITRAMNKEGELVELIAEKATNDDLTEEKERAEAAEQAIDAKFEGLAEASSVTAEIAAAVEPINEKDAAQDEELAKKVEWVESTPGRNHIVLKNHDNILGTATDGTTYNLAMVSKWDVADFGTTSLHLNFNTSDAVTINDNKVVATEDVVDEKIAAIDGFAKPEDLEPKADASAVTEEIAAAIAPLAVKTEVTEEINAVSDALAQFETQVADEYQLKGDYLTEDALEGLAKESAVTAEIAAAVATVEATVATKADATAVEALEATVADKADASAVTEEIAAAVAILNAKDDEQDAAIEEKANADDVYTKADADAKFLTNDALEGLASEDFVSEEIEKVVGTAPENFDTLEEFADALADLKVVDVPAQPGEHYTQEEIDAAQEGDDAYGKTTDDWKVEPVEEQSHNMTITEFVESVNEKPQIESINRKYEALLTLLNLSDADVNSVIVNQELVDSNSVVFDEGPINNIVVPEATKSKTITAELDPDTDLTLTSRYSVTINNTSEEPTDLTVTAPAVSGYNAATITLNDGEFDTVTLTDASLTVNTGASVQNVVITQETTKNLTINAMFAEGATITSESSAAITLTNKNPEGEEVSVVLDAPGATVTMSGGKWVNVEAAVSPDTLIINSNAHIENLTVTQGNVLVKVARQSDIESVVKNYTLAPGSSIDYLHDEISASNVSNLATTGTHTLVEDITKSGRFAPGIFASDNMVWNLNGHNITFTNTQGYANFLLRGSLQLEINGEGNVVNSAGDYGFWAAAEGVKVVVNGGHFEAATHVLYAEKGTIEVNGGSFKLTNPDECDKDVNGNFKFLLNCKDENYTAGTAKIIVRGGKFYGFNPAVSYGEPGGPVSFVADGFHVVESLDGDMKVFEVVADE